MLVQLPRPRHIRPEVEARCCGGWLWRVRGAREGLVRAWDGYRGVLLLARGGADVVVLTLLEAGGDRWGGRLCADGRGEASLLDLGGCACDLDGRCLQGEGLGLGDFARVGVLDFVAFAVLRRGLGVVVLGVAWGRTPAAGAGGKGTEAGGVGGGLGAELGEVEVGSGLVAHGHGLPELALGPEAVEDDGVDDDAEGFDYDFDDAADEGPVLRVC